MVTPKGLIRVLLVYNESENINLWGVLYNKFVKKSVLVRSQVLLSPQPRGHAGVITRLGHIFQWSLRTGHQASNSHQTDF